MSHTSNSKENSNLPKNHSMWVIFETDKYTRSSHFNIVWFESRQEAREYKNCFNSDRYTQPIKFTRDY